MGVFGRFGVCLNPAHRCYYLVDALLTVAELPPTDKDGLIGFEPCDGCTLCTEPCPVRAIDVSKAPAEGYNMELCFRFLLKLRQRYEQDAIYRYEDVKFCSRCFVFAHGQTTRWIGAHHHTRRRRLHFAPPAYAKKMMQRYQV